MGAVDTVDHIDDLWVVGIPPRSKFDVNDDTVHRCRRGIIEKVAPAIVIVVQIVPAAHKVADSVLGG